MRRRGERARTIASYVGQWSPSSVLGGDGGTVIAIPGLWRWTSSGESRGRVPARGVGDPLGKGVAASVPSARRAMRAPTEVASSCGTITSRGAKATSHPVSEVGDGLSLSPLPPPAGRRHVLLPALSPWCGRPGPSRVAGGGAHASPREPDRVERTLLWESRMRRLLSEQPCTGLGQRDTHTQQSTLYCREDSYLIHLHLRLSTKRGS